MTYKKVYMILTVAILLLIAACNNEEAPAEEESKEEPKEETATTETESEEEEQEESDTVTYHNDFSIKSKQGEETSSVKIDQDVELAKNADSVVVLDLGVASTMAALDLEDNVVGLPKGTDNEKLTQDLTDVYDNDNYEDLGQGENLDFEKIQELDPEVIMISDQEVQSSIIRQLEEAAPNAEIIHVSASSSSYLSDISEMTNFLGQMYEVEDRANKLVEELDSLGQEVTDMSEDLSLSTLLVEDGEAPKLQGISSPYGFIFSDLGFTDASINQEADVNQVINTVAPDLVLVVADAEKDIESLDYIPTNMDGELAILDEKIWKDNSGGYLSALHQLEGLKEILQSMNEE